MRPQGRDKEARDAVASVRDLLAAGFVIVAISVASLWLFKLMWHRDPFEDFDRQPGGWLGALAIVLCSAFLHEVIHALGWHVFAKVPWRSMSLCPTWSAMGFAARIDAGVPARAYRAGLAMPALILAGSSIGLGLASDLGLLLLWGLFFLLECYSDVASLIAMRHLPSNALVYAHVRKTGCR